MIRNQRTTGRRAGRNHRSVDASHILMESGSTGRVVTTLANFDRAVSADPATWLISTQRFAYDVASLIPASFPSFARVFHPATRREGNRESDVRWADVASAGGRTMHPAAEWGSLTGSWQLNAVPGCWDGRPAIGYLPNHVARRLGAILATVTAADEVCWFGVWNGFPDVRDEWGSAPTFSVPHREMYLLSGALASAGTPLVDGWELPSPNLWWPDSHEWCVATDIDLMTTYVGGDVALIQQLVASNELEAVEVPATQGITWDSDTVNPLPDPPY